MFTMDTPDLVSVTYPLPGNDVGGRVIIYGLDSSKVDLASTDGKMMLPNQRTAPQKKATTLHVLFFCGGFPDHWTTFQPLAQRLSATQISSGSERDTSERIICGVTCLPGYDTHHDNFKVEGYTFDEMAVSLQSACKVLLSTITEHYSTTNEVNVKIQLTGIFHDWGSYVGAMVVNRSNQLIPNYYHKVIFFDVLPSAHPKLRLPREKPNVWKGLILMSYTSLFALCHSIQRYISCLLAIPLSLVGYSVLHLLGLLPIQWLDNETFLSDRPKEYTLRKIIYMQYPYYYLWRGLMRQGPKQFLKTTLSDATLPENVSADTPNGTPVLYMYGTKKNAMFHDANTVAWLQQHPPNQQSSSVVKVEGVGHWLYRQNEDICYEAICKFIGIV
jgi:pimeloyl-ACP methyl ester carboxylesterase